MNSQKRIDSFFKKSDRDTPKKKQCQEKDVKENEVPEASKSKPITKNPPSTDSADSSSNINLANSGFFRLASVEFSKCAARAKVQASNLATSGCLLASKFQALLAQGLVSLKVKVEHWSVVGNHFKSDFSTINRLAESE